MLPRNSFFNAVMMLGTVGLLAACGPATIETPFGETAKKSDKGPGEIGDDWGVETAPSRLNYIEHLARGEQQRALTCGRGNQDRLAQWYCGETTPTINGLEDVLVGLGLKDPQNPNQMTFAISGHSSSLVTKSTTVLNPRAVIFTPAGTVDYLALGYLRGDGFAEVAAFDTNKQDINFYLISYMKGCEPNCTYADRFLPENETNWQNVTIYNSEDLKNTVADCKQCHVPGGEGTPGILRMQELVNPWTHWFRDNRGTNTLLQQFRSAHVNEDYAGIPAANIANSDPADLEDLVRDAGFGDQPNLFRGNDINGDDVTVADPNDTWMTLYENGISGQFIAPPFFGINPYDPEKVALAGDAYRDVIQGNQSPGTTPDLEHLFDSSALAYLSFTSPDGLTATEIVNHRCGTCHDGRFPGISRDNFRIQDFPNNLTPEMKSKIKARLRTPDRSRLKMPPVIFSKLDETQIRLIESALE